MSNCDDFDESESVRMAPQHSERSWQGKGNSDECDYIGHNDFQPITRFNPRKAEHVAKYECKKAPEVPKEANKNERISSEKVFYVDEKLRQSLMNEDTNFSLLQMFGGNGEQNNRYKPRSRCEFQESREVKEGNFRTKEDFTLLEERYDDSKWWHKEPLFFQENDSRFEEAVQFVSAKNDGYRESFDKYRREIKHIVRNKKQKQAKKMEQNKRKFKRKNIIPGNKRKKGKPLRRKRKN